MRFLDKLERKFGRFAIKGLIKHIVFITALVYVLQWVMGENNIISYLYFDPRFFFQGEYWRIISFLFIPPTKNPFFLFFALYLLYIFGTALEQKWGSFKFNLYYFVGFAGIAIAGLVSGYAVGPHFLNLSIMLAFALLYPNFELKLFFVLPVKIKYLAWISWGLIIISIVIFPLAMKVSAIASIANYLLFFWKDILLDIKLFKHRHTPRSKATKPSRPTYHKCTVCGITEKDDPEMDFRYCSSCNGDYEYCMKHLKNHEHIK
mgnify:CR=1 FL=1